MTFLEEAAPRQTERAFMESVFKLARMLGWACYHTYDSRRSEGGFPDAVMLKRPRVLFVEFKADRGKLTDAQRAWLDELRACGQEAYVWRPKHWAAIEKVLR
jgi:VRR-NUC domain